MQLWHVCSSKCLRCQLRDGNIRTRGMRAISGMAGPGCVNSSLWQLVERAVLCRVKRENMVAEAGDMTKYFDSSDSGHDEMPESFSFIQT